MTEPDWAAARDDLSELVSIIIITSPVASNPDTEMLDRCIAGVIQSFPALQSASILVGCDGVSVVDESAVQGRAKTRIYGKCSALQFENYQAFLRRLRSRKWLQVSGESEWQGFALTLQGALNYVTTPFVMVLPHDYELTHTELSHIDLPFLIQEMHHSKINYIGLPNPRSAKFGLRHAEAIKGIAPRLLSSDSSGDHLLEPLAMWKENPHFAKVEAYQSIVYANRRYKRGQFIEDTLGQEMLLRIKEHGEQAFCNTYLLGLANPCSFHMDGPRYLPIAERQSRGYKVKDFEIEAAKNAAEWVQQKDSVVDRLTNDN